MQIIVHLHDILRDKVVGCADSAKGEFEFLLPAEASVRQLLQDLGLEHRFVGLVVVNGQQANKDYSLQDGDRVELFSPMSGG